MCWGSFCQLYMHSEIKLILINQSLSLFFYNYVTLSSVWFAVSSTGTDSSLTPE